MKTIYYDTGRHPRTGETIWEIYNDKRQLIAQLDQQTLEKMYPASEYDRRPLTDADSDPAVELEVSIFKFEDGFKWQIHAVRKLMGESTKTFETEGEAEADAEKHKALFASFMNPTK